MDVDIVYRYKKVNTEGNTECLLTYDNVRPNITDPLVVEITKEEYEALLAELLTQEPEESETDEISAEEALDIILGGEGV